MGARGRFSKLVLQRRAAGGSVRPADFEEHAEKYESGWGQRSPITDPLALLWLQGQIVPASRLGSVRRWALADTWFRTPLGPIPEHPAALRQAAVRSLRALGMATQNQVKLHFARHRYHGLSRAWKALEAAVRI